MRARLRSHIQVRADTIDLQLWIRAAFSHLWIFAATIIFIQGGVILVGLSHSAKYVAIYNAAGATSSLMALSLQAANALSAPKFAELHVQKRQADLQNLFTAVVRITLWPSLAIAAGLIAFGTPLLLLFGPDFDQGYSVLTILTLGQLTNVVTGPVANLLNMTGHQLVTAKVTVLCAVVYVLMGVVLTPIWGTVGAALALSGTFVFLNVWLGILVVKKLEIYPTIFSSILGRGL
jgi:O-antigen/teichoic acid export membrane protein